MYIPPHILGSVPVSLQIRIWPIALKRGRFPGSEEHGARDNHTRNRFLEGKMLRYNTAGNH